jgi:hypothetical protein
MSRLHVHGSMSEDCVVILVGSSAGVAWLQLDVSSCSCGLLLVVKTPSSVAVEVACA